MENNRHGTTNSSLKNLIFLEELYKNKNEKTIRKTVESILEKTKSCIAARDIGVHGFRKAFELFPESINIGILEQSTIGPAA